MEIGVHLGYLNKGKLSDQNSLDVFFSDPKIKRLIIETLLSVVPWVGSLVGVMFSILGYLIIAQTPLSIFKSLTW